MKELKTAYPDRYKLLKQFAKENRDYATDAEDFLWQHVRGSALGVKFRRQHPIGDYIADFFCLKKISSLKLMVAIITPSNNKKMMK